MHRQSRSNTLKRRESRLVEDRLLRDYRKFTEKPITREEYAAILTNELGFTVVESNIDSARVALDLPGRWPTGHQQRRVAATLSRARVRVLTDALASLYQELGVTVPEALCDLQEELSPEEPESDR